MTERMTDERLAEIEAMPPYEEWDDAAELLAALKAERERVRKMENGSMRTGALPDWMKHNHPAQLAIREQARRAEAAEAKVAEYEFYLKQHPRNLMNVWRAAEAKLEAVRGLKRMEIKATQPHEVLFADGWNSLHDELEALLK